MVGASGQVGRHLWQELQADGAGVAGTYASRPETGLHRLDITDGDAVRALIFKLVPEVVWLPAALPDVDRCEREPELSRRINLDGPRHIGEACRQAGARLVFFSTDYVFDGVGGPFLETDAVRPLQVYGTHKAMAEENLLREVPESLIIRPAWVYSRESNPRNFVWRILQQVESGGVLKAAADQISTPTPAGALARMAIAAATRGQRGILHLAGPERLTRYALTCRIARLAGYPETSIVGVATSSLHLPAARPLDGGLVTAQRAFRIGEKLTDVSLHGGS